MGLTRGTNRNHIVRATLESIALQVCDVIDAMEQDAQIPVQTLRVDGGASANDFLMQFQADMLNIPVNRPASVESTAIGAAYLAGLAVGYWKDVEELRRNQSQGTCFSPTMTEEIRLRKRKGWKKAVTYAFDWAKEECDHQ